MARVEPIQTEGNGQRHVLGKTARVFVWLVKLPFKLTFRFLLFALFLLIIIEVARTGIWDIPVVSDIFYRKPTPVREVPPEPYSLQLFGLQIAEQSASTVFQGNDFTLSEGKLTAMQQEIFKNSNQPFAEGQLTIEPEELQFYANLKARPNVIITAELEPIVEKDSTLRFQIQSIKIGQVRIPQSLVSSGITSFLGTTLSSSFFEKVKVLDVTLERKNIILQGIHL